MELREAMRIFTNKIKNRKIVGYWVSDGTYIFNTKSYGPDSEFPTPSQFVVTESGEVYGTNPMSSGLMDLEYTKLPIIRR